MKGIKSTSKYTNEDLKTMQGWSLERKIQVTQLRVMEWYERWEGKAYISFSGGKDSTVLLDLARRIYPNIEAVFIDTGLEYPEIREFVKTKENVTIRRPEMPFHKVIQKYGYPVVSKEQSAFIQEYRSTNSEKLKNTRLNGNKSGNGKISKKWRYLIDAPFLIGDKCCDVMKKNPCKKFEKESGKYPITAIMADESSQRKSNWLKYGCNAFEKVRPTSQPMSFWTEQDVIRYLIDFSIDFAEIYGDAVYDGEKYYVTGEPRTGCMFCMYGMQYDVCPNKFQRMKINHPDKYEYCIRPVEDNGLGLGGVLDYIGIEYK